MKIEIQKPNIVRIAYHQEKGDPHYGSCMWAYFDFDLDLYMLNIQSDCGNAAYRWHATPKESFLHLMERCDDGYMLGKMFDADQLDVDAILKEVREQAFSDDDEYIDDSEREMRDIHIHDLEGDLNDCETKAEAASVIEEWAELHDYDVHDVWQTIVTDYTANAKKIFEIFRDFVQPKIREILANGGEINGER